MNEQEKCSLTVGESVTRPIQQHRSFYEKKMVCSYESKSLFASKVASI